MFSKNSDIRGKILSLPPNCHIIDPVNLWCYRTYTVKGEPRIEFRKILPIRDNKQPLINEQGQVRVAFSNRKGFSLKEPQVDILINSREEIIKKFSHVKTNPKKDLLDSVRETLISYRNRQK